MAKSSLAKQRRNSKRLMAKKSAIIEKNNRKINNNRLPLCLTVKEQKRIQVKAESGCKKAWQALERSKAELEQYYEHDLPKYKVWYESSFKKETRELDELRRSMDGVVTLIRSVKREAHYYRISEAEAYRRVSAEGYVFVNPEAEEKGSDDIDGKGFSYGAADDIDSDDDGCNCPFCVFKRRVQGFQEQGGSLDQESFRILFDAVFEESFDQSFSEEEREEMFDEFERQARKSGMFDESASSHDRQGDAFDQVLRCTHLFRKLAKELHPDRQGGISAKEKEIWFQALQAYEEKNLQKLETVWLLFSIFHRKASNKLGAGDIALSALAALRQDLKDKNASKRSEIRRLKRCNIWGFSRLDSAGFRKLSCQEADNIKEQQQEIAFNLMMIKRMISEWQRLAARKDRVRVSKKKTEKRVPPEAPKASEYQQNLWGEQKG